MSMPIKGSTIYRTPALQSSGFRLASALVALVLANYLIIVIRHWQALPVYVIGLLTVGVFCVPLLWILLFTRHRYIYGIWRNMTNLDYDQNPKIVNALSVACNVMVVALVLFCVSIAMLLRVVFLLSKSS